MDRTGSVCYRFDMMLKRLILLFLMGCFATQPILLLAQERPSKVTLDGLRYKNQRLFIETVEGTFPCDDTTKFTHRSPMFDLDFVPWTGAYASLARAENPSDDRVTHMTVQFSPLKEVQLGRVKGRLAHTQKDGVQLIPEGKDATAIVLAPDVQIEVIGPVPVHLLTPGSSDLSFNLPARGQPLKEVVVSLSQGWKIYGKQKNNYDGIGKVYLGREISHVMGHLGAGWLERDDREAEEKPQLVIDNMGLKPDSIVADIGAGSGYFSFRIAPKIPQGKVMAIDIQQEMLDIIETRKKELGIPNVEGVLGKIDDPKLPPNSIDFALFVDAYHEFDHPHEMMTKLVTALRPGGRIIQIEYRTEDPDVHIKQLHKMTEKQARIEMEAVGLTWIETKDILPQQHFMIFEKAK